MLILLLAICTLWMWGSLVSKVYAASSFRVGVGRVTFHAYIGFSPTHPRTEEFGGP
jgi:hypothetical protein